MRFTESSLRKVIRKSLLEANARTLDLAAILKRSRVTTPGAVSRALVGLAVLGSEGFEIVAHLPFSGKYQKGYKGSAAGIYQNIARAVSADDLSCQVDGKKVCTFEIDGETYRFTFGLKPKSTVQRCREEAESLRSFYNVPEDDIRSELENMGWSQGELNKAL